MMASWINKRWTVTDKTDLLLLTYISSFLERFTFFAHNAALTFLIRDIGVTTQQFGLLKTVYGICLFLGAPVFGRMSDVIGSRLCLALVLLGSASVYGSICLSYSIGLLLLSQVPAFFCQSIPAHQILVGELTDEIHRPSAYGKIGMSIGLAVITGPLTAGQLMSLLGARATLVILAILCSLHAVASLLILPDHSSTYKPGGVASSGFLDVEKIKNMFKLPNVVSVMAITFTVSVPLGIHQAMTGLLLVEYFKLMPVQTGYVASFIGIVIVVVQGFGISRLSKTFTEKEVIKGSVVCMACGFFGMIFVRSIYDFCIVQAVMLCGLIITLVFIQTMSSKLVPAEDRGTMIGLVASLQGLSFAIGPSLGAFIISHWSLPGYAIFGFTLCAGLFGTIYNW